MTTEEFENTIADLIDRSLTSLRKEDIAASLERLLKEVRSGVFDPSIPSRTMER